MSYQFTGLSEEHEERAQQLIKLHERYLLNDGLIEEPEFEIGKKLHVRYHVKFPQLLLKINVAMLLRPIKQQDEKYAHWW